MSKEILDAIGVVAYGDRSRDPTALEDALLARIRRAQHAKPFARVEFGAGTGDIRVFMMR
jgi:hypothetical protein